MDDKSLEWNPSVFPLIQSIPRQPVVDVLFPVNFFFWSNSFCFAVVSVRMFLKILLVENFNKNRTKNTQLFCHYANVGAIGIRRIFFPFYSGWIKAFRPMLQLFQPCRGPVHIARVRTPAQPQSHCVSWPARSFTWVPTCLALVQTPFLRWRTLKTRFGRGPRGLVRPPCLRMP